MKALRKLILQISIAAAAFSLPCSAADLTIDYIRNQAFDNNVYNAPKPKEISLFSKNKKNDKKENKVSVEHYYEDLSNFKNSEDEYIKKYKVAKKKKIRKKQFNITIQANETNSVPVEEADVNLNSVEDKEVVEHSNKNFFSKLKDKKAKNKNKNIGDTKKEVNNTNPSHIILSADKTDYYPERGEIEAIGNAKLELSDQNFVLYGDKLVFNHTLNGVRAYDNVKIIQGDNTTTGDFVNIDMSTACGWIQKPVSSNYSIKVKAEEAYVYPDRIEEYDGIANIMEDNRILVGGSSYSNIFNFQPSASIGNSYLSQKEPVPVKFKVKDINVVSQDGHNVIKMKGIGVYYRKFRIGDLPSLQIVTDKEQSFMQLNVPEIGNDSNLGMFVGPAIVLNTPLSSTLKIAPLLVYSDDESRLGVGAMASFMSSSNFTQAAYGTAEKKFMLKGHQSITPKLRLNYSQNTYTSQWFMGYRRPMYAVELEYADDYFIKDLNASFQQRISAGAYSDFARFSKLGEGRLRWMTQLQKNLLSYTNSANTFSADFGIIGQSSLAQYTSGDTFGVLRVGPTLNTTYKNWSQNIIYYQSGAGGQTPFLFDDYYYSKSNLQFLETLRLNKFISLGYIASLALGSVESYYSGAYNPDTHDLFQENMFLLSLGPDEAKVTFIYDAFRKSTAVYFSMLLGTKDMDIAFKKSTINNPDTIANENKKLPWIKNTFDKIRYKVFPLTNPAFDRSKDLYPALEIENEEFVDDADILDEDIDKDLQLENYTAPFIQNQDLMKKGL